MTSLYLIAGLVVSWVLTIYPTQGEEARTEGPSTHVYAAEKHASLIPAQLAPPTGAREPDTYADHTDRHGDLLRWIIESGAGQDSRHGEIFRWIIESGAGQDSRHGEIFRWIIESGAGQDSRINDTDRHGEIFRWIIESGAGQDSLQDRG